MATLLARTYQFLIGTALEKGERYFADVDGTHADAVNAIARVGITAGFADGTFGPGSPVRRDQMASFLARFVDLLIEEGVIDRPR